MDNINYKKYGIEPSSESENIDFNKYGIEQPNKESSIPKKENNFSYAKNMATSNQLVDPMAFLNMSMSGYNPRTTGKEIAESAGKLGNFAQPELMIGKGIIPYAANALGRIGSGTAAMTSQQLHDTNSFKDLGQNVGKNALINTALEAVPLPFKAAGKALDYFKPDKFAQGILDTIGNKLDIGQNAREFAKKIQSGYNAAKDKGQKVYNDIFNSPSVIHNSSVDNRLKNGRYTQLPEKITDKYNFDLEDLHNDYLKNPTPKAAHQLQSQLGFEERALEKADKKSALSQVDKNTLIAIRRARSALLGDMGGAFDLAEPGMGGRYQDAAENWLNTVIPYEQNGKISQIVKSKPEKVTSRMVHNLGNEFKNPDEDMNKIIKDIGPEANNHILYDRLGKLNGKVTAENLTNEVNKLKNEGFGNYISSQVEGLMSKLGNRGKARLAAQGLPGGILGALLGSNFGAGGELIGASLAAPLGIAAIRSVNALLPKKDLLGETKNALSQLYRPAGREAAKNAFSK